MNPFRVQCETCRSWLKVRDEALIGQIHACPKCGGMVHLVPMQRPDDSASASVSMIAPASAAAGDFDSVDDLGLNDPPPNEAEPAPESQPAPTEELTESSLAASPAESLGKKVAIGVGGSGAALALLGVLAVYLLGGDDAPTATAPQPLAAASAKPPVDQPTSTAPEPPVEVVAQKPASEAPAEMTDAPRDDPAATAPSESNGAASEPPTANTHPAPQSRPATEPADAEPAQPEPSQPEPAAPEPQTIDPLDHDPANLDLVLLKGPRNDMPAEGPPGPKAPDPVAQLDSGLATAGNPPDDRVAMIDRSLAKRAQIERVWVERGLTGPNPLTAERLARRLAEPIPELYLPSAPLADALRLWSELAGVPVTIDPTALARAGVGPHTRVSLEGRETALGEVLARALDPVRLDHAQRAGQLVLIRGGADSVRDAAYDVSDLGDANQIAELAATLVPSLTARGVSLRTKGGRLELSGPALAHFDLAIFCERVRLARRLPQRTKYPADLLRTTPALAALHPVLEKKTTFSFVTPTPLTDVVDHWRKGSGLEILVDWASLADQGLGPYSTLRCSATDRTWGEVLHGVLSEMGLAWRPVSDATIGVATQLHAAVPQTLEFYPLADGTDGEQLAESLRQDAQPWKFPVGICYDAPSRSLLVRGNGAAHDHVYGRLQDEQRLR